MFLICTISHENLPTGFDFFDGPNALQGERFCDDRTALQSFFHTVSNVRDFVNKFMFTGKLQDFNFSGRFSNVRFLFASTNRGTNFCGNNFGRTPLSGSPSFVTPPWKSYLQAVCAKRQASNPVQFQPSVHLSGCTHLSCST